MIFFPTVHSTEMFN